MKKITFLVAGIMLLTGTAKASEIIKITDEVTRARFSFDEPISFMERGIEFFVFANGEFDFNTRPQDSQGDYLYMVIALCEGEIEEITDILIDGISWLNSKFNTRYRNDIALTWTINQISM